MTKLLSCRYNMDTNRVEARFMDGTTLAIDCIAVEDEYGNTPARRTELDWLLYLVKGSTASVTPSCSALRAMRPIASAHQPKAFSASTSR